MKAVTAVSPYPAATKPESRLHTCLVALRLTTGRQSARADQSLTELSLERKASTTKQRDDRLVTIKTRLAVISDMLSARLLGIGAPSLGGLGVSRATSQKPLVTTHAFNTLVAPLAALAISLAAATPARATDVFLIASYHETDACGQPQYRAAMDALRQSGFARLSSKGRQGSVDGAEALLMDAEAQLPRIVAALQDMLDRDSEHAIAHAGDAP